MKKQVVTMFIGDFIPDVCKITMPTIEFFAKKIGAEYKIITESKFNMPSVTYEKFQLYEMSRGYDWTLFLDADTLVNPDTPDWTECVTKEVSLFNGLDLSIQRCRATDYNRRSKSLHGACTWNVMFSDWCRDLWHPLDELTWEEAMEAITPVRQELASGTCNKEHLIDDFLVGQNIARYGLKVTTIMELMRGMGQNGDYYCHLYACSPQMKLDTIKKKALEWGLNGV